MSSANIRSIAHDALADDSGATEIYVRPLRAVSDDVADGRRVADVTDADRELAAARSQLALTSDRLRYSPVDGASLARFHSLVTDEHVRQYLMDGQIMPLDWSRDRIRDSEALFTARGVGLWLADEPSSNALVGFCGFIVLPTVHPEPQLIYAMFERFTGRGYATEMAAAAIAEARTHPGFDAIVAAVDEVNVRSSRVLEKLGFERVDTIGGAFGNVIIFRLAAM